LYFLVPTVHFALVANDASPPFALVGWIEVDEALSYIVRIYR